MSATGANKRLTNVGKDEKMNKGRDVGQELYDWAVNEMKFSPQGRHVNTTIPDVETFRRLCRGRGRDYWEYVINHVKSSANVNKIQMNLALQCKGGGDSNDEKSRLAERRQLIQERNSLRAAVLSQRANMEKLETEVKRSELEVAKTESTYRSQCAGFRESQHKRLLLTAFSDKCNADTTRVRDYTRQIHAYTDKYKQLLSQSTQTQYYSRAKTSVSDESSLESACTKEVRETCEMIAKFLRDKPKDTEMSTSQDEQIRQKTEHVTSSYPANQIMASLVEVTNEAALDIRLQTQAINITDDVTKLRFNHQGNGGLKDVSEQPSVEQSVDQLIHRAQLEHVLRFISLEKHQTSVSILTSQLEKTNQECHLALQQNLGGLPDMLDLTKMVLDVETKLAGSQAELKCSHGLVHELTEQHARLETEKATLMQKYQRIQDFTKIAEGKQNLIKALVRQSRNSQPRLQHQRAEIHAYVDQSLRAHRDDVTQVANQMQGCILNEKKIFATLSVCKLATVMMESLESVSRVELTINKFRPDLVHVNPALVATLEKLNFPFYKASDALLSHCVEMQRELNDYHRHSTTRQVPDCARTGSKMADILSKVDRHDQMVKEKVLPKLDNCLRKTMSSLADCIALKDLVNVWWDQPGQYCTPWVEMDGKSYQDWKDEWTILCTRLRQLQRCS